MSLYYTCHLWTYKQVPLSVHWHSGPENPGSHSHTPHVRLPRPFVHTLLSVTYKTRKVSKFYTIIMQWNPSILDSLWGSIMCPNSSLQGYFCTRLYVAGTQVVSWLREMSSFQGRCSNVHSDVSRGCSGCWSTPIKGRYIMLIFWLIMLLIAQMPKKFLIMLQKCTYNSKYIALYAQVKPIIMLTKPLWDTRSLIPTMVSRVLPKPTKQG